MPLVLTTSPEAHADALASTFLSTPDRASSPAWGAAPAADARRRRAERGGRLLFDRLLSEAGVDALFPPSDPAQVRVLLVAILTSAAERELQNALVYYLVLEHVRALNTPGRDALDAYAVSTGLPTALRAEMEAYASVDHGEWATAVPLLGDARLFPDVFEMLAAAPLEDKARAALLLQLFEVRGALPALGDGGTDPARIREYAHVLRAMVQVRGVARAWALCRTLVASLIPAEAALATPLYTALLDQCYAPPDTAAIEQLLALPLDAGEEKHLEAYALAPASAKRAPAALVLDTLLVKLVSQGRYVDAIALDRRTTQHEHTHASVARGRDATDAAHLRIRRKTLLDGVWAVLPAVQRDALQAQDLRELPDPAEDDEPMDDVEPPASLTQKRVPSAAPAGLERRVRTPMSSSLGSSAHGSPDARLLRSAVRGPSFSQRGPSPAQPLRDEHPVRSSPALRNSSPFAGWQRGTPERKSWADRSTHRAEEPRWGAPGADTSLLAEEPQEAELELEPVPEPMEELPLAPSETAAWLASSEEEPAAERAARSEEVAGSVEAEPTEGPPAEADGGTLVQGREPEPEPAGLLDGRGASGTDTPAAEMNTDPAAGAPTQGRRPGSRRGLPRQTKRHVAENAELSTEASTEPSIPGGFPLSGSAPEKAETPRRRRQRSVQDTSAAAPTPPSRGRKAARGASVEPSGGALAELDALHDTTPIARRTRAARAELESLGSQTSADAGDVSDAGSERAPPTPIGASSTPQTRRRTRASARAETPQRSTPRRSRRRGVAR